MKFLKLILCVTFFSLNYAHASASALEERRTYLFDLDPKDALQCEDLLVGDHVSVAKVTEVKVLTDTGFYRYYEVRDQGGFETTCKSGEIKKLPNYFQKVIDGKKYRSHDRAWANGSNINCQQEGIDQLEEFRIRNMLNFPFLIIKKIYGQVDRTEYQGKEIRWALSTPEGKEMATCDSLTYQSLALKAESYTELSSLNSFFEFYKEKIKSDYAHGVDQIGFCSVSLSWNVGNPRFTMSVNQNFFQNEKKLLLETKYETREALINDLKSVITETNCLIHRP